ncbi:hypothetical protein GCM10027614_19950 [Micromonospora vulcania]
MERLVLDVFTAGRTWPSARCTVLLLPVEDGTRLELTVEGLSGVESAEHMREGWQWCLEGIAAQLGDAE